MNGTQTQVERIIQVERFRVQKSEVRVQSVKPQTPTPRRAGTGLERQAIERELIEIIARVIEENAKLKDQLHQLGLSQKFTERRIARVENLLEVK